MAQRIREQQIPTTDIAILLELTFHEGTILILIHIYVAAFVSIYDAIDHLDIAAEKECCLSALSTFASPAWVSLTDLNHETQNHAYEAISISIVQPEVVSLVIKEDKMFEKD